MWNFKIFKGWLKLKINKIWCGPTIGVLVFTTGLPFCLLHRNPRVLHQDVIIGVCTESQGRERLLLERWRTRWRTGRTEEKTTRCEGYTSRCILSWVCTLVKLWFVRTGTISNFSLPPAPVTANMMEWMVWREVSHFADRLSGGRQVWCRPCYQVLLWVSVHSLLVVWERPRCCHLHFWGRGKRGFPCEFSLRKGSEQVSLLTAGHLWTISGTFPFFQLGLEGQWLPQVSGDPRAAGCSNETLPSSLTRPTLHWGSISGARINQVEEIRQRQVTGQCLLCGM